MANVRIDIGKEIADKIKLKYSQITERTMGSLNMIVDAYYPSYVVNNLSGNRIEPNLSRKVSAISPFIAQELGIYQIKIEDLTAMLGYKPKNIKKLLSDVKEKNINLCLVGLGGTGMNFYHWMEELCNMTNTINIFQKMIVFDADTIDITNIFRMPMVFNKIGSAHKDYKINLINRTSPICKTKIEVSSSFIYERHIKKSSGLTALGQDYIFYGAPDITTREMFKKVGVRFISGTHGDDDCQLAINPEQDSMLQVESYGMINLSVFFMNQIKLTLAFLELLASDKDLIQSEIVMDYSFAKEYSNNRTIKTGLNRTYNFPIIKDNFLDREENLESIAEEIDEFAIEETDSILEESMEPQVEEDLPISYVAGTVIQPIIPSLNQPLIASITLAPIFYQTDTDETVTF